MDLASGIQVKNYIVGNAIFLQVTGATFGKGIIALYGIDGKLITSKKVVLSVEPIIYTISKPLTTGMYILSVQSNGTKCYTGKVLVP